MRITVARLWRAVANALALILIALALHAPPVREYVRAWASARATRAAGVPVSIGRLHYNLLTLVFEADDVAVASPRLGAMPRVIAGRMTIDLSWWRLLTGRLGIERLLAWELGVAASYDGGPDVEVRGLALTMDPTPTDGLAGRVRLQGPASVHAGPAAGALTELDAAVTFDGRSLLLDELHLATPGADATFSGTVDPFGAVPRTSIHGVWRVSVQELCATWLSQVPPCDRLRRGTLQGRLTLDGAFSSPVLHIDGRSDDLVTDAMTPIVLDGEAILSSRAITIPRFDATVLGGTASVRSAIVNRATFHLSGAEVAWHGIDLRAVSRAIGVAVPVSATNDGRAVVAGDLRDPSTLTVEIIASLPPAADGGVPAAGRVDARMNGGQGEPRPAASPRPRGYLSLGQAF